jgi:hypothetical protein
LREAAPLFEIGDCKTISRSAACSPLTPSRQIGCRGLFSGVARLHDCQPKWLCVG